MDIPRYAVFPGWGSIRIKSWFRPALPPRYIMLYFRNGRVYQICAEEGFTWDVKEGEGAIIISGWTPGKVHEIAQRAGRENRLEAFFFCTPSPVRPVYTGTPIRFPTPPSVSEMVWDAPIVDDLEADDERQQLGYDVIKLFSTRRRLTF